MQNLCLCRVRDLYRSILQLEGELQRVAGLNLNEAMLLCLLSGGEVLLSGDIAEKLGLSRSNASKLICSLERRGLIRRQACPEDSRCQRFRITRRGQESLELMHEEDMDVPPLLKNYLTTEAHMLP